MSTTLNDLVEGTYYARAFATNSVGTSYSNEEVLNIVVVDTTTDTTTDDDTQSEPTVVVSLEMSYRQSTGSSSYVSIQNDGTINHSTNGSLQIRGKVVDENGDEMHNEEWELLSTTGLLESIIGYKYSSLSDIGVPKTVGTHKLIFAPSNTKTNTVDINIIITGK